MAAAEQNRPSPSPLSFLDRLVGRFVSHRHRRGHAEGRPSTPAAFLDPGDDVVVQLADDVKKELTIMMGCADTLANLLPKGQADHEIAELRQRGGRAMLLAGDLRMAARLPRPKGRD
jgi:hypothetical protein